MNIKKTLLTAGIALGLSVSALAETVSANTTTNGWYLLSTNRASAYQVGIVAGSQPVTVSLYDCDMITDPFLGTKYTNAAYVIRTTIASNYVTSFVGYNGYTNWYTNVGIATLTTTNAANTNNLPAIWSGGAPANSYVTIGIDALFVRGITAVVNTNATVSVDYRPAR